MSNVYESDFILPAMVFLIIQVFKTMTVPTISTLSLPIQSPSREGGRWETKHFIGMSGLMEVIQRLSSSKAAG